jgi:hypothetical protein
MTGVDAVRYSFIVMDLHHLLLAGLPGALRFGPKKRNEIAPRRQLCARSSHSSLAKFYYWGRGEFAKTRADYEPSHET